MPSFIEREITSKDDKKYFISLNAHTIEEDSKIVFHGVIKGRDEGSRELLEFRFTVIQENLTIGFVEWIVTAASAFSICLWIYLGPFLVGEVARCWRKSSSQAPFRQRIQETLTCLGSIGTPFKDEILKALASCTLTN